MSASQQEIWASQIAIIPRDVINKTSIYNNIGWLYKNHKEYEEYIYIYIYI